MKRSAAKPPQSRGRPRGFDADKAVDRALAVFWKKGYEGASLDDLTRAMRINRPSLYAAFGNKQSLFRQALDRYITGPACYVREALAEPTARRVVDRLFDGLIDLVTNPKLPHGCLLVQGALTCDEDAECIQKELSTRRELAVTRLRERFEQARRESDLPRTADPADLARFVATLMHGLSVQAAGGASRDELRRVVRTALRAWPE